jgi:hypothetical protein
LPSAAPGHQCDRYRSGMREPSSMASAWTPRCRPHAHATSAALGVVACARLQELDKYGSN